jgi:histidinol-phosphate aminotransferase
LAVIEALLETEASPAPRALLAGAAPPHEARDDRGAFLRLDLNEDLSGPLVRVPMPRAELLATYPTSTALRSDLAAYVKLPESLVWVTAGADEAIYGLMRAYLDPGDGVLLPWPTFGEFPVVAAALGAVAERAAYGPDLAFPLEAYRAVLARGPRLAVLVTPANPTGEAILPETVLDLAAMAPETLLLVDEAYAEYGGRSILEMGPPPANVAVIRTFSKAYGLAAARVGYLVAHPPVIGAVRQVLPSYSLAAPSLRLAQAGLARRGALAPRVRAVHAGQRRLAAWGRAHGIAVHTTAANFVLLRLEDDATAQALAAALEAHGVLVADRTPVLPGTLRATVGARRHVDAFLQALGSCWLS